MQGFLLQASELFSFHLTLMFIGNFNQDSFRHVRDSKGHYKHTPFHTLLFFHCPWFEWTRHGPFCYSLFGLEVMKAGLLTLTNSFVSLHLKLLIIGKMIRFLQHQLFFVTLWGLVGNCCSSSADLWLFVKVNLLFIWTQVRFDLP